MRTTSLPEVGQKDQGGWRSAHARTEETKASTSESSGQKRSQPKCRRIEGDGKNGGDDEGDEEDRDEPLPRNGSRDSQANLNFACPSAKRIPFEHPQYRGTKFQD